MGQAEWITNSGVYLGRDREGGILLTGPVSAKEALSVVTEAVLNKEKRVVMYQSGNGKPPVLEIIMEMLRWEG